MMIILDLCGGTGAWSRPYADAGYDVRNITLPEFDVCGYDPPANVHGILAAPPCTCFSYARNRYPVTNEELADALLIVYHCFRVIMQAKPHWWALENPVNKLRNHIGRPVFGFRQWEYGDPADKPTCLWGDFNIPMFHAAIRTKPSTRKTNIPNASAIDGITPPRFAQAFFRANP